MKYQKGQSGNLNGRPKGESFMDKLKAAIKRVEKEKEKPLIDHFIEQAYEDNDVLKALMNKVLPNLRTVETNLKTDGPFRLIIETSNSNGPKDKT